MQIRDLEDGDWAQTWPILREVIAAGQTYTYDPKWSEQQVRDIWVEAPPGRTVVAGDPGEVLGSAKMGPNRPGPGAHVATASFMVGAQARGLGVGRMLGEEVLAWARREGYAAMQFNAVVETNHSAVHLWRSLGFQIIGTVPRAFAHPQHGRVGLHVMHLEL